MKIGIDLFEKDLYGYGDSFLVSGRIRTRKSSLSVLVPNHVPYDTSLGLSFCSITPEDSIEEKYDDGIY